MSDPGWYTRFLGQACTDAYRGLDTVGGHIESARRILGSNPVTTVRSIRLMQQNIYGDLAEFYPQEHELEECLRRYYSATIDNLEASRRVVPWGSGSVNFDQWIGLTNELTFPAVVNRLQLPGLVALPALGHLDCGAHSPTNYDVIIATARPLSSVPTLRKIEIRSRKKTGRSRYRNSEIVTIVSAARWFGYEYDGAKSRFPVADLLVKEAKQGLSASEAEQLDETAVGLLNYLGLYGGNAQAS